MSFLAPLYLAGLAAIAAPIIFHMIRRTPRGRIPFSTVMFLDPSPPRITRRKRIEHWLLLLLRGLALTLLALAFSRPFLRAAFETDADSSQGRRVAILLDTSASMQRGDLWQDALKRVTTLLAEGGSEQTLSLATFDHRLNPVIAFEEWSGLPPGARADVVLRRLKELSPAWGGTDLGRALVETTAAHVRDEEVGADQKLDIIVVSDLQQGSRLEALQRINWPVGARVILERVKTPQATNAGLQIAAVQEEAVASVDGAVRVRVVNAADSVNDRFQIRRAGVSEKEFSVDVVVPAGESRIVRVAKRENADSAETLVLSGDDHDFDNRAFQTLPAPRRQSVVYYSDDTEGNVEQVRFFLERAFPENELQRVTVLTQDSTAPPVSPTNSELALVVVAMPLPNEHCRALREYATRGGHIVFLLRDDDATDTLQQVLDRTDVRISEADVDGYAMLSEIDFSHRAFQAFDNPKYSDFTQVRFWRHRELTFEASDNARVLAKFEAGAPALVEFVLGKGALLAFASGWDPEETQFALSTKFVPFVNALLEAADPHAESAERLIVGDAISVTPVGNEARVHLPDESAIVLASGTEEFSGTAIPGPYRIAGSSGELRFAVNLETDESETSPLDVSELESRGVIVGRDGPTDADAGDEALADARQRQMRAQELESRQDGWRWLIVAAALILLVETWLGGKLASKTVSS